MWRRPSADGAPLTTAPGVGQRGHGRRAGGADGLQRRAVRACVPAHRPGVATSLTNIPQPQRPRDKTCARSSGEGRRHQNDAARTEYFRSLQLTNAGCNGEKPNHVCMSADGVRCSSSEFRMQSICAYVFRAAHSTLHTTLLYL